MPLFRGDIPVDPKNVQRAYYGNTLVFDREPLEDQPLPPDIPAAFDPNWEDVAFILNDDYDYTPNNFFGSGNRAKAPIAAQVLFRPNTLIKPSHLPFSFEQEVVTNRVGRFYDPNHILAFGSGGEFTIEGWIYTSHQNNQNAARAIFYDRADSYDTTFSCLFGISGSSTANTVSWGLAPSRRIIFVCTMDGIFNPTDPLTYVSLEGTEEFPLDVWVYIAVCRDADGWIRLFANGQMIDKKHIPTFYVNTATDVGRTYCHSTAMHGGGYYANIRISRTALYTSDAGHEIPLHLPIGTHHTGDPFWSNTTFLMRCDMTNEHFNGSRPSDISRLNNSPGSSSTYTRSLDDKYGGRGSLFFAATSSATPCFFLTNYLDKYDMKGLMPFTAEAWINRDGETDTSLRGICGFYRTASNRRQWSFHVQNNRLGFLASVDGTAFGGFHSATEDIPLNGWTHVAMTRDAAGIFRLHQNGQAVLTFDQLSGQSLYDAIGLAGATRVDILGYNSGSALKYKCSEIRVTKGIARYGAAAFTPPQDLMPAYKWIAPEYNEPEQAEITLSKNYEDGSYVNLQSDIVYLPFQKDGSVDFGDGHIIYLVNTLDSGMLQFQTAEGQNIVLNNTRGFLNSGEVARARFVNYIGAGDEREAVWELI